MCVANFLHVTLGNNLRNTFRKLWICTLRAGCLHLIEEFLSLNGLKTLAHSFLKCVTSNKLDRSEDDLINIRDLEYYDMSATEKEFHLLSDEESDDSSSVENEISYDEGNADENSSSEHSSGDSIWEDCWDLAGYLTILEKERFHEKLVVVCILSSFSLFSYFIPLADKPMLFISRQAQSLSAEEWDII